MHEFFSRLNLIITYREDKENQVADALSRFAYPAGESQDTNFHGGNEDLEGWEKAEHEEWQTVRDYLKTAQPAVFSQEQTMLQQFEFAKVPALQELRSVSHLDAEPRYVGADGATYHALIEHFVHTVSHLDLSGSPEPEVMKAVRFTARQYSRSAKKELNCKAKTQHKGLVSTLTLATQPLA